MIAIVQNMIATVQDSGASVHKHIATVRKIRLYKIEMQLYKNCNFCTKTHSNCTRQYSNCTQNISKCTYENPSPSFISKKKEGEPFFIFSFSNISITTTHQQKHDSIQGHTNVNEFQNLFSSQSSSSLHSQTNQIPQTMQDIFP